MIERRALLGGGAGLAVSWCGIARAQGFAALPASFARIEAARGGRLGVVVLDTGSGARAGHRQDERFPILSTFKLLAAACVLARADAGQESIERRVRYTAAELVTYSPVTSRHVGAGMTLVELCEATMLTSDNTAGNLLLDAIGGPAGLTAWLRGIGDPVTRLDRRETELNEARPGDPRDTTTPAAMAADIAALALGEVLSPASRARLVRWLRDNRTGDARLRAGLPDGWSAGERTGTGGRNTSNDVGLLFPPGGAPPLVVAAYLTEGAEDGAQRDAALADVAAAVVAAWTAARG
jgi:beta-lactamase class A